MTLRILLAIVLLSFGAVAMDQAQAGDPFRMYQVEGNFEDVTQDLQDAIINRGLVVDYVGHVGQMLARTGGAVGKQSPYKAAEYYQFCSSSLTYGTIGADPRNISICPYIVFAYELNGQPGKVHVGYRLPVGGGSDASKAALAKIDALLDGIVKETAQ